LLCQFHNVDEQLNEGLPLGVFLDEFSMIPANMLGQVYTLFKLFNSSISLSTVMQVLRRVQQLHNNVGKLPFPSLFILSGDPYQA